MEAGRLRTLVTGASGFLGSHVLKRLQASGYDEIFPVARAKSGQIQGCDLCNKNEVRNLLNSIRPTKIFHCAGSFSNDFEQDFKNNALATFHLLQAIDDLDFPCRILLVGSAAEYGIPESETGLIPESQPLKPVSLYGLSKACQTQIMAYFQRISEIDVVMARIFNLDGEGVSPLLFPGHVRTKVKEYLAGEVATIEVGDLSAYRDYLSVDEAADHIISIMENGETGEVYNVGSGLPVQMKEYLKRMLKSHDIGMNAVNADKGLETKSGSVSVVFADLSKLQTLKAQS